MDTTQRSLSLVPANSITLPGVQQEPAIAPVVPFTSVGNTPVAPGSDYSAASSRTFPQRAAPQPLPPFTVAAGNRREHPPQRPDGQITAAVCANTPPLSVVVRNIEPAPSATGSPIDRRPRNTQPGPRHILATNNACSQNSMRSQMHAAFKLQSEIEACLQFDPCQISNNHTDIIAMPLQTSVRKKKAAGKARQKTTPDNQQTTGAASKEWGLAEQQSYASAQRTSAEERAHAELDPDSSVSIEECLSAKYFAVIENDPFLADTHYSDCLLFSLVQHMTGDYDQQSQQNRRLVAEYRQMLVEQGWSEPKVPGGFGPDGYMAPASASTLALVKAINEKLQREGELPLRIIFHEYSRTVDGAVKEFLSATGAANGSGRVVHIQNADGQHYEALLQRNVGAQSFKQPTTKQPEKNAKSSQPRAAATSAQSTVVAAKHGRAAPLTLTAKQKEAINRCEVDFSLVLSCITTLPVIRQTAGEPDTVFASGIAVTKHRPVDSVSEAIILSRQGEEWVVRLREAGKTTRLRAISQPMLPAGILEKLPQNLLAVTDASAICAMFAPETIIYIKTGLDRYIAFFKVAHTQSSLAARQKCAEIAVEFQALPHGSSIVRRSFFQAAIDHLIKQPAEICNIIPIIIDNLGCPAPEMLKIITASMAGTFRSDPGQIIRTSAYLYYLAKRLPADQSAMLDEAVKQMLAALLHRDGPISPHNLFKEIGKTIYADLWQQPIENEITKKEVMFYYTRFITAIQQSEFSQIEQYCASEALWPLAIISCTDDELVKLYWPKYRAEMNSFTLHINGPEEKDKLGIDDRLLCMLINNIYSAPEIWAPYAISRFYKFIAAAGEDGNMPLATLSLIEAANMIISPPYARQLLNNIFKKNLKGANIIRGMTILMTNTLFSEESRAEIYKNTDENAIDIFVKHWIQYKNLGLPTNRISKGQCLALDNNSLVVINEQDVSKVNGRKLFTREANQTLMQYDILERMVFSSDEYLPLFREILLSLPKIKNKTAVMVKIIDANMQGDSNRKDRIHELNMRLQRIVENVVPALKKQRDITLWQPLVENILSIQIMLLGLISGDGAVKLSENVSHNLASIESSDSMTTPLIILQRKIKKDHLKKELVIKEMARNKRRGNALPVGEPGIKEVYIEDVVYLDIISRAVEKSCVNNPNADGQYLRTMIFNNAQYILENIDKLFISVAQISTNLSCTLSGFEAFVNIAIREMEIPPQIRASSIASKPAGALNKIQLEAFSSFIRSKPIAWDIIDKAYTAKAGSPVNIDWIINPESFLSASPEVQVLMLNFILARLPNDTRGYLHRYLAAISSRIASEAKEVILLENTLIRICNFLQSKYMTSFAELIEPILSLSQSLKGKKQMLAVSSPLKNSLKSMLNAVQEANPAQYTTLSEQYKELLAPDTPETTQQPGPLFFQDSTSRNASSSESSWRSDSRSTSNSNSSKPTKRRNTTGTDSTSESKSLHNIQPSQKTKTITAPTLYVGNNWAELNATADQSQALQQALRLMLSDSRAHELRLHKYKHSAMLSIDIKPRDIQDITASWEGRSDCRGMLLKGSNNRYLLLKVGTHAQAIAEAKNYQKASKPMVDAMIDNLSAQYQKLDLNPATGQLEMVEHDAAAGHG